MPRSTEDAAVDAQITRAVMALARAQGLQLADLSERTGISRSTLYRRTTTGGWTAVEVAGIAAELGCTPAELYGSFNY